MSNATEEERKPQKKNLKKDKDDFTEFEAFEKLPENVKKFVEATSEEISYTIAPFSNPIEKRITAEHIGRILDISERADERAFTDGKETRKYTLIYILIFTAIFIFTTIFLVNFDKELYKEAIKLFAVFLGGLGGGFGVKSYMDRNK